MNLKLDNFSTYKDYLKALGKIAKSESDVEGNDLAKYKERLVAALKKAPKGEFNLVTHKFEMPAPAEEKILLIGDELRQAFRGKFIKELDSGSFVAERFVPTRAVLTSPDLKKLGIEGTVVTWTLEHTIPGAGITGAALRQRLEEYVQQRGSINHATLVGLIDEAATALTKVLKKSECPDTNMVKEFIRRFDLCDELDEVKEQLEKYKATLLNTKIPDAKKHYMAAWEDFYKANFEGAIKKLTEARMFVNEFGDRLIQGYDPQYDEGFSKMINQELGKTLPSTLFASKLKSAITKFSQDVKNGKFAKPNDEMLAPTKKFLSKLGQGNIHGTLLEIEKMMEDGGDRPKFQLLLEKVIFGTQSEIDLINQDVSKFTHSYAKEYLVLMYELNKRFSKLHHPG